MTSLVILIPFLILSYGISLLALVHCLLRTKHPQAALAWSAVIILLPIVGSLTYLIFGLNRIDSRAAKLMAHLAMHRRLQLERIHQTISTNCNFAYDEQDYEIIRVGNKKPSMPRQSGNTVSPLYNGDEAYPEMLTQIQNASHEILLCTYIFGGKKYGQIFINALIDAKKRGVEVRVIVDGLGSFFTFRQFEKQLLAHSIDVAQFIPPRIFPPQFSINLRNHRKLLICDSTAFTGGMNIDDGNVLATHPKHGIQDVHFKIQGSIVSSLREAFLLDWVFLKGHEAKCDLFLPEYCGNMDARLIMDGPGNADEPIQNLICGVISAAKKDITIFTPYFLPTREITSAITSAIARGVQVTIVLPEKLDHAFVGWACEHILPPLLHRGVQVYRQPPPFAHTKLILIDTIYTLLGSSNLDPRSLSLNFELNMEVFSKELNATLREYTANIISKSTKIAIPRFQFNKLNIHDLLVRLRNAAAWIFSPYL